MLSFKGFKAKDLCDPHLAPTRRTFLRVGGCGMLGLSLPSLLQLQAASGAESISGQALQGGGPGWGKAKSIILVYLQGGPSHLDLWDPKENVPDNVKSVFNPISTKIPGIKFTENLPKLSSDQRSLHDDSFDVLHAQRFVQSHRGDLSDDDRLHDRQGQPVGTVGTAIAEGLSKLRQQHCQDASGRRADVAVRDVAATAAGIQRGRQGWLGRFSRKVL